MSAEPRRARVLVVTLGRRGGVTRYGFLMASALATYADVAVVSSAGAENRDAWAPLGVRHLEVETFSSIRTMVASLFAWRRFSAIGAFARAFAPDVVYYPGGHAWKPVLDLLLPRSARTVLTVHDPELHAGEDSFVHRAFAASNRLRTDGYVLLNEAQRAGFVARHHLDPARVAVIPHGIFDDTVGARRPLADLGDLASIAADAGRYLLFVGRIERYKGLRTLLEAYGGLDPSSAPPLVIAGSGTLTAEEQEALGALTGRPVTLVNRWLTDVEVASLVASARFVVLPYESATQSGVVPLSSAFGVPAIVSDTGGLAEQVLAGRTGLLFEAGDAGSLTRALRAALALPAEEYARMSADAAAHARSEWSWDVLAQRLLAFVGGV